MSQKPDYKRRLDEQALEEKRASKLNYDITAFMLKRPYSDSVVKGPLRLVGREAHRKLVEEAKSKKLYVWYAAVVPNAVDNTKYNVIRPHLIDWDSVPDRAYDLPPLPSISAPIPHASHPADLKCEKCGHQCNSTSGYTLHLKSHQKTADDEGPDELKCPHCTKQCSSTSGLTLHINYSHPDK